MMNPDSAKSPDSLPLLIVLALATPFLAVVLCASACALVGR
jgi:hypothetical protein